MQSGWRLGALRVGAGLLMTAWAAQAPAAEIEPLGFLPDGISSVAGGLSADGSVVVGDSFDLSGLGVAFRWTAETGMVGIGVLEPLFPDSQADGVSPDGAFVVGTSIAACPALVGFCRFGFRWSEEGGMENIGSLFVSESLGSPSSVARAATTLGDVLTGRVLTAEGYAAFRWSSEDLFTLLPVPEGSEDSRAVDVTPDGSVVVGDVIGGVDPGVPGSGVLVAARWVDGVFEALDPPFAGGVEGTALAVSPDGGTVVGLGQVPREVEGETVLFAEAVRWPAAGGREALGILPDPEPDPDENPEPVRDPASIALAVTADGQRVVGESIDSFNDRRVFLWTEADGIRLLETVLAEDHGVDVSQWELGRIAGISDDGRVLAGTGVFEEFDEEGVRRLSIQPWRIALPVPVPEPGFGEGVALAVLAGLVRLRARTPKEVSRPC